MRAVGHLDLERGLIGSLLDLAMSCRDAKLAGALLERKEERRLYSALVPHLRQRLASNGHPLTVQVDKKVSGSTSRNIPDISIHDGGSCVALVEAKMAYAVEMIDAARPRTHLFREVQQDIDKLRNEWRDIGPQCMRYALVFLVYNHQIPAGPNLQRYGKGRLRLTKRGRRKLSDMAASAADYGEGEIQDGFGHYLSAWRTGCSALSVADRGKFDVGFAHGTEVSVFWWLLRVPLDD